MCIGYQLPPKNTTPFFFARPPSLNQQMSEPPPLFRQSPLILVFRDILLPLLIARFFSKPPKY